MKLASAKIFGDFGAQVMLPTRMLLFLPHPAKILLQVFDGEIRGFI